MLANVCVVCQKAGINTDNVLIHCEVAQKTSV